MILRQTIFSPCRQYRYTLWRDLTMFPERPGYVQFIGLNPSKADEVKNDNTVTRCINFAKSWGYGSLCMTNIFAYKATDPEEMKLFPAPIGHDNDRWLILCAQQAALVVAAWGNDGEYLGRAAQVMEMLNSHDVTPTCLDITKQGEPIHPLYVPGDRKPIPYRAGG
jgi:hypothetical protein